MQSDGAKRRRQQYGRCHTLAVIPDHSGRTSGSAVGTAPGLLTELEEDDDVSTENSRLLPATTDSPVRRPDPGAAAPGQGEPGETALTPTDTSGEGSRRGSSETKARKITFQDQVTMKPVPSPGSDKDSHKSGSKNKRGSGGSGGRSGGGNNNTPGHIFSKIRNTIREKVFQSTATEWPQAAAIIQEKRQRSVEAFAARLNQGQGAAQAGEDVDVEQIQLKDVHKQKRGRMKSEPLPAVVLTSAAEDISPAEAARHAFRRRSISEDTYDRRPCLPIMQNSRGTDPAAPAGVVCSNEDLEAIVSDHKKKSPKARHKRSSLEPQGSVESSSSSYSTRSYRTESVDGEYATRERDGHSPGRRSPMLDSLPTSSQYPEVILEERLGSGRHSQRSRSIQSTCSATSGGQLSQTAISQTGDSRSGVGEGEEQLADVGEEDNQADHAASHPSSVPEIVFDEFGQTWDVYGADFDAELLGNAIQKHLETLMTRRASEAALDDERRRSSDQGRKGKARESINYILRFLCSFSRRTGQRT